MAHPCISEVEAAMGTSLSLHTGGNWAGHMPSFADLEHECADDMDSYLYDSQSETSAMGEPVGPAVASFAIKNLTPLGYSQRSVPYTGAGSGVYNSDLAFKGNLVIAGTYEGFRILDFADKTNPTQLVNYTGCNVGQGDVVVYGDILVRSWDQPASSASTCAGQLVGEGFEGIHIFDISNPSSPQFIGALRFSQQGMPAGALLGCGSHTASAVPDPARDALYIYNGGSSGTCEGIDIFKIKISDPNNVSVIGRASNEGNDLAGNLRAGNNSCHDNNILLNVGGTTTSYAMCAGGNGLAMYKFDLSLPADAAGGVEKPTLLWTQSMNITTGHSGSFTYDGKYLIFGHEPGGGSAARCQETSTIAERTLFFLDPVTGETKGTMLHPRPQNSRENCTWHNFNVVPTEAGYYATVGSYQSGISVFDFSNPSAPRELAYADPAVLNTDPYTAPIVLGGDWSTYWHNGYIYQSDIKRGVLSWELNLADDASAQQAMEHLKRTKRFTLSNPQTQTISYAPEAEAPTITVTSPTPGQAFKMGSSVVADFSCADNAAVDSCTGTVADGESLTMGSLGNKVFKVTAIDSAGNMTTKEVPYMVNSRDIPFTPGGTVETVMNLTLETTPASFGAFKPGETKEYLATIAPRITSSAGNAALTVHDPAATATGRLVNGTSALSQALQVYASGGGSTAGPGGAVGGAAAPTALASWAAPVGNSGLTLLFRQFINSNENLRSGVYSKTLTFTLSTTAP